MYVYCRYNFRLTLIHNRFSKVTLIHLVLYSQKQTMKINVREHQRAIKNEEANIQRNWQHRAHKTKKTSTKNNTICVGRQYTQTNINNVNKT